MLLRATAVCPCLLATLAVNLEDINHSLLVAQPVDYPRQAEHVTAIPSPCEKTAFFEPYIYINDHFAKTGSGQS
jgi:hypothetical protein